MKRPKRQVKRPRMMFPKNVIDLLWLQSSMWLLLTPEIIIIF
jgi:hypothetical protein